jgi:hypothetical protein
LQLFGGTKKSLEKDVNRQNGHDVSNDEIITNDHVKEEPSILCDDTFHFD